MLLGPLTKCDGGLFLWKEKIKITDLNRFIPTVRMLMGPLTKRDGGLLYWKHKKILENRFDPI